MKNRSSEDDDYEDFSGDPVLGFTSKSRVSRSYSVHINTDIRASSYYSKVFDMLLDSSDADIVTFWISSPGGRIDGLSTLLEGIKMTNAHTLAVIVGEASSAASILALSCDEVVVSDSAESLVHHCRFGAGGKAADVRANVDHTLKITEKLARSAYRGFLTEPELEAMLDGKEYFFDADQLRERIQRRVEYLEQEAELEELKRQEALIEKKPSKKKKKE